MFRTASMMAALLTAQAVTAQPAPLRPDQTAFRALYKELVETNTTLSSGSCTLAAERMAAHLKAAGLAEANLHFFSVPEHPKEGGLVAIYPGRDAKAKAVLMLAHLDIVERGVDAMAALAAQEIDQPVARNRVKPRR